MKMFKFVVFALVALLLVAVRPSPVFDKRLQLEEACVRQGGLCLPRNECGEENLVRIQVNLCPKQKHLGVECCYI